MVPKVNVLCITPTYNRNTIISHILKCWRRAAEITLRYCAGISARWRISFYRSSWIQAFARWRWLSGIHTIRQAIAYIGSHIVYIPSSAIPMTPVSVGFVRSGSQAPPGYHRVPASLHLSIVYMAYCHLRRNCKLFLENLIVSNHQIATIKCSKIRLLIA